MFLPQNFCNDFKEKGNHNFSLAYTNLTYHNLCLTFGRVASWLATCARKLKVPSSSPATSYVQRWAPCSNRPLNVEVSVKRVEVVVRSSRNALPLSLQSCDLWMSVKENQDKKKNLAWLFIFILYMFWHQEPDLAINKNIINKVI